MNVPQQLLALCCISLLSLTACQSGGGKKTGDKYADVFAKHQSRITELRSYLSGLNASLKDPATTTTPAGNLDPVPSLSDYDTSGNTLILQSHLLASPENFTSYDSLFGLYYNMLAAEAFRWTGTTKEQMIAAQDYLEEGVVDTKIAALSPERFPYLLIIKVASMEPLQQKTNGTFEGGGATAFFYLFDWRNKKELSSVSLSAKPDPEMLYAYQSKDGSAGKNEAAEKKARETMQKNMRAKVYAWLQEITGGAAVVPNY